MSLWIETLILTAGQPVRGNLCRLKLLEVTLVVFDNDLALL